MAIPAAVAPTDSVGPEFFRPDMPLEHLRSSPLNPRKHFDEAHLQELANSFVGVGIIEPLVARPVGDHYEIVCGDRRSRAAKLAGLGVAPVIVKCLTDAQALEIMVIENNQRENVSPLEEGDGFGRLLASGYDLHKLSERLGRSKKYVYDRIKLLDLVPTAKQLLLDGKMSAGHGILLARLKPEDQARAINPVDGGAFKVDYGASEEDDQVDVDDDFNYAGVKPASVRELDKWIATHVRFDVAHAAAAAPLEYGDVAQRVEEASAKPGRGKKVIPISFAHFVQPDARDENERTFGPQSFKFADGREHYDLYSARASVAPKCEHAVLGVVAAGEKYGQAFDVCIARAKCQVHWKKEIAEKHKNQKLRESGQGTTAAKNEQRASASREAANRKALEEEARRDLVEERALALAMERVTEVTPELLRMVLSALVDSAPAPAAFNKRFGLKVRGWDSTPADFKTLSGRSLVQALVFCALQSGYGEAFGDRIAFLKVDLKKVDAEVAAEIEKATAEGAKKPVQTSAQKPAKGKAKKKR